MASMIPNQGDIDLNGMSFDRFEGLGNVGISYQGPAAIYPTSSEMMVEYFPEHENSYGQISPSTLPQQLASPPHQPISQAQLVGLTPAPSFGVQTTVLPFRPDNMDAFGGISWNSGGHYSSATPQYPLPQNNAAAGHVLQQPFHAPGNNYAAHSRSDSVNSNATYGRKPSVPIPRATSKTQHTVAEQSPTGLSSPDKAMTATASGPMSSNVTVPPRPRPGRKPIAPEDSVDRRRVQNRMAQRNFRDKRQQKLAETQKQLEEIQAQRSEESSQFRRQLQANRDETNAVRQQLEDVRRTCANQAQTISERDARILELEKMVRELQSNKQPSNFLGTFRDYPSNSKTSIGAQLTNPAAFSHSGVSPPRDIEIDFTNFGKKDYLTTTTSHESNAMDYVMDRCGFCSDDQNCACAMDSKHNKMKSMELPSPVPTATNMPGSCDACRADPERAKACREMAAGTRPAPPELNRSSSSGDSGLSTSMPPPPPRRSCGSVIDQFRKYGQTPPDIKKLFGREVTTYPGSNGGYEFKETEAAEVLQTLSGQSESSQSAEVRRERRESLTNGMAVGGSRPV